MPKLRISVPSERFETTATLLHKEAPKTCSSILNALPIEGYLMHAVMSGNESALVFRGERTVKLKPENWVYAWVPGDILYFYSMWGDNKYLKDNTEYSEIVFIYGRYVRVRDLSLRETAANLFGRLDGKIEGFAKVSEKAHDKGPMKLRIEKA
jgi:hypothetical protein